MYQIRTGFCAKPGGFKCLLAVCSWVCVVGLAEAAAAQAQDAPPAAPLYPIAVAAHANTVFVVDRKLPGVWKHAEGQWSIYHQAPVKFGTPLNAPWSAAMDIDGRLLVGDSATRDIYRFDDSGTPQPLTGGKVGMPMGIAVAADGTIYVTDLELGNVRKIPAAGGAAEVIADVPAPRGIFCAADGVLWVISAGPNQLVKFMPGQRPTPVVKGKPWKFPHQVVVLPDGTARVTDGYGQAVYQVGPAGEVSPLAQGAPLVNPVGLCQNADQTWVADPRAMAVFRLTADGQLEKLP